MKAFYFVFLAFYASESVAVNEFEFTRLYDMYDFRGNPQTPIHGCEVGCRVYLSYPTDDGPGYPVIERTIGEFTIEVDATNSITFSELHNLTLADGQKAYFDIPKNTGEFIVRNPNGNGAVRPLALLVVRNDYPNLDKMEVYEATEEKIITSAQRVMLINVSPFTFTLKNQADLSVTVKTSPADMLENDDCDYVYKTTMKAGGSFDLPVSSPVISLLIVSKSPVTITSELVFDYERSIDFTSYVSSPGFIGCYNKSLTFLNENYNVIELASFNETYIIGGDKVRHVVFHGVLDTDIKFAPIHLYDLDTDEEPLVFGGRQDENTSIWDYELTTSHFQIFWDGTWFKNGTFLIRYEIDPVLPSPLPSVATKSTAKTTKQAQTSPKTSSVAPVKSSVAPVKTSVAPVKTSVAPVQTSPKPSPAPTTSSYASSSTVMTTTTSSGGLVAVTQALLAIFVVVFTRIC